MVIPMTQALPDNLGLLSLQLALQIDRRLNGREFDPSTFAKFGTELSNASGAHAEPAVAFLSADPLTAEIFSEAIEETSNTSLSTIDEVAARTGEILSNLKKPDSLSADELNKLKAFCLAFHKSILAQQAPPVYERENSLDNELQFTR